MTLIIIHHSIFKKLNLRFGNLEFNILHYYKQEQNKQKIHNNLSIRFYLYLLNSTFSKQLIRPFKMKGLVIESLNYNYNFITYAFLLRF